jgi:glycosyltransferase involved in cell wall biosynthesis
MKSRKRLGLIFSYNEQWIGGTYYTLNLIHALNILSDEEKPEIIAFSNEVDFTKLQKETRYPYLEYELFDQGKLDVFSRLINKITYKVSRKVLFQNQYNGHLNALFVTQQTGYFSKISQEKCIYWIADFQDKHYPQFFNPVGLAKKHERSQWIAENAKNIILSSEAVKQDWLKFYPNYKGVTKVVHFAVTHPEYESLEIVKLRNKFNLPEKYFFSPNQFWAHKNQMVVIKAAEILKEQGNSTIIVFSGKENDNRNPGYIEKLKSYVNENNLGNVIHFLGFLDRREQLKLMKNSVAVIQPSLFEGWSTVIEDAMLMNQKVIASDIEVNIEQLGDQGYYFDRLDPIALAELLEKVSTIESNPNYNYTQKKQRFAKNLYNLLNEK